MRCFGRKHWIQPNENGGFAPVNLSSTVVVESIPGSYIRTEFFVAAVGDKGVGPVAVRTIFAGATVLGGLIAAATMARTVIVAAAGTVFGDAMRHSSTYKSSGYKCGASTFGRQLHVLGLFLFGHLDGGG